MAQRKGIGSLADCTASVLHDYGLHARDAGHSRSYVTTTLASVTRLWAFEQLSSRPSGIGRPPWEDLGGAYLTGMRPAEILGLRTGCCPDPLPGADGRRGRHLIRGHEYKNATDEYGNHQPAGVERDVPWVAIIPLVNAIRVLERMVPDGHLLFDCHVHDPGGRRDRTGSLKKDSLPRRIEDFAAAPASC